MPSSMSNHLEARLLDLVLRGTSFVPPSTVYAGLLTALAPESDGEVFTEIAEPGYARQAVAFAAPAGGAIASAEPAGFAEAAGEWPPITHAAVFDAAEGGHVLFWHPLAQPLIVRAGEGVRMAQGAVAITLGGAISTWLADGLLRHALRGQAFTPPPSVHLGLLREFISDEDFTEVAGGGYGRRPVSFAEATAGAARSVNDQFVTFAAATASWGTVAHAALFDAPTQGHLLWRGSLATPRSVSAGRTVELAAGGLVVGLD